MLDTDIPYVMELE